MPERQALASTGVDSSAPSPQTDNAHEGHGPLTGNLSALRIGLIWLAANLVVTTLLTGTLFVPGLSWAMTLGLIVLGTVVGASVLVLVGNMGTRTGLSTMSLSKGAFGLRGAYLTTAANVLILMGWCWVQAMLAGVTVNYLVEQATGYSNPILFSVICQAFVVLLAIYGHAGIAKVEPWLALIILTVMAYILYLAFSQYSIADFIALPADQEQGWSAMIVLDVVIATAVSWTVLSAEFNRFAKSQTAGIVGSGIGYILSTVFTMGLGATIIAYMVLQGDSIASFDPVVIVSAFGVPLALVIFLSVMATNTMVMYGMVSSVVNLKPAGKIKFLPTALTLGAISLLGASWLAMLDQFTAFLTLVGSLFIPVFAIMMVDYYIVKKGFYDHDILRPQGGKYWYWRGFNIAAIGIWAVGVISSVLLTYIYPCPIGATVPTFVISLVLYWAWASTAGHILADQPNSVHLAQKN